MVQLRGARVVLRDKRLEDAEQDYIWRSDPELARLDAAYPLNMTFDRFLKISIRPQAPNTLPRKPWMASSSVIACTTTWTV